jgi:hypothetical protein
MLVVVKAYPNPSAKYVESSCVAGIRTDTPTSSWLRLYPVHFRDLESDKQFKKYQTITLEVDKGSDVRPESYRPNTETIAPDVWLDTSNQWVRRRVIVEPMVDASLCAIQREQASTGRSLGAFRPLRVTDFHWETIPASEISDRTARAAQQSLLAPWKSPLEILPYRFKYRFRCSDRACRGHDMTCVDWEVGQAFRRFRTEYGEQWALAKMKEKFLHQMCGPTKDTIFYTGNAFARPNVFLILGVFWPPRDSRGG